MAVSVGGRVTEGSGFVATDLGRPAGLQNSVVLLTPLQSGNVASLMASLDAFFGFGTAADAGAVYLFSPWPVPDISGYSWEYVEAMPLMMRSPSIAAHAMPTNLQVIEVQTGTDLRHFEQVMIEGFPVPELKGLPAGSAFGPALLRDSNFRFFVGWHDGLPVTASATYVAQGMVHLIFLATIPGKRGNGFGSAVAWEATLANSVLPAMLMASEDGLRVYPKLGYRQLCEMPLWKHERP